MGILGLGLGMALPGLRRGLGVALPGLRRGVGLRGIRRGGGAGWFGSGATREVRLTRLVAECPELRCELRGVRSMRIVAHGDKATLHVHVDPKDSRQPFQGSIDPHGSPDASVHALDGDPGLVQVVRGEDLASLGPGGHGQGGQEHGGAQAHEQYGTWGTWSTWSTWGQGGSGLHEGAYGGCRRLGPDLSQRSWSRSRAALARASFTSALTASRPRR